MYEWARLKLERMAQDPVPDSLRILAAIVAALVLLFACAGCAQQETRPISGICAVQPAGERGGIYYFHYLCEPHGQ